MKTTQVLLRILGTCINTARVCRVSPIFNSRGNLPAPYFTRSYHVNLQRIIPRKINEIPNQSHRRCIAQSSSDDIIDQSASNGQSAKNESSLFLEQSWHTLLRNIHTDGHFSSDPHISATSLDKDKGALKRAILNFARQRNDIFHTLLLKNRKGLFDLIKFGIPDTVDRKTSNAYKRLHASVIKAQDLLPGEGGAADFQDVCRLILSCITTTEHTQSNTAESGAASRNAPGQEKAVNDILLLIIDAMKRPPSMDANLVSDKAKNMKRLQSKN